MKDKGVSTLYFCGLAAEYCVYFSIIDALKEGFEAILIEDATRAISQDDFEKAKKAVLHAGGKIIGTSEIK